MYSQRDEELVILEHAPAAGRFLDIGAYEFKTFSNTRALAERGWGGVLVEPSPEAFCGLMKNAEGFKDLKLVNALATVWCDDLVKFYTNGDAVSTSEPANVKKWQSQINFREIFVPAIPINSIISDLGEGWLDFISIDTEGTSFEILRALHLDALHCNLICVEMDEHEHEIRKHVEALGFSVIHKTEENLIAKRA